MSKINIDRIVKDIRTRTSILTPIIEAVCNSMDAIGSSRTDGRIDIIVKRDKQSSLNLSNERMASDIIGIDIIDNGEGFTESNRDSFDTFRSGLKSDKGGKGFGRFMYLKYFQIVKIESNYKGIDGKIHSRDFSFGHANEIIEDEKVDERPIEKSASTGTILHLSSIRSRELDKGLDVIARKLCERLLTFLVIGSKHTPIITIKEDDGTQTIILNEFIGKDSDIRQVGNTQTFTIKGKERVYEFSTKVYKIYYSPISNKICLTANMREVTDAPLHVYVPEFKETMTDFSEGGTKNFTIKVYVQGEYLDENVNTERDSFAFGKEKDILFDISERDIYKEAALIAKDLFKDDIEKRFKEKKKKVEHYVFSNAPWNKSMLGDIDMENIPVGISEFEMEMMFQRVKFDKEQRARIAIKEFENAAKSTEDENLQKDIDGIMSLITDTQRNDLVHYVCQRKKVIDLFDSLRKRTEDGKTHKESEMHSLFFPMITNDRETEYDQTNLWLLDERFNFTQYIASDKVISKVDHKEPDLALFFEEAKFYRNGENIITSPIAIVEFKRPKRTNYPDNENPITQALRYANKILSGKYEMPDGIEEVCVDNQHTPVYIYIICDIVDKIREYASYSALSPSPDGEGYFGYNQGANAYIEIKSFKKVISDAKMRNNIFFKKLGLL